MKQFLSILVMSILALNYSYGQEYILGINSTDDTIIQFSKADGSLMNSTFIDMTPQNPSLPKALCQVDNSIWVACQNSDNILRYTLDGTYEGEITGGLDNIRGINVVGTEVWVTNAGSGNGATADAIARYDFTGSFLGYYPCVLSPFDVLDDENGTVYIASFSSGGIQKMDYSGADLGIITNSDIVSTYEQINFTASGDLLAAVFNSTNQGINVIDLASGTFNNTWDTGNLRGVIELDNGNFLFSTSGGISLFDINTQTSTSITTTSSQYFTYINSNLSVEDIENGSQTKVYPNPVEDFLHVNSDENILNVEIYKLDGSSVNKKNVNASELELDLNQLQSGYYILKIQYSNTTETVKFIKK